MQPFTDSLSKAPVSRFQTPLQDAVGSGLARSMLDASPDCIKLISLDGDLVYMNHNGMCAMEIDNFCDVENKSWPSLWPEEGQDLLKDALENAALGKRTEFDAYCPTARGTPRWWNVNVAPVHDASGAIVNFLATSRDVTDRVQAENVLRERDLQLQSYAEKLTRELNEKQTLIERQRVLSAEIDHRVKNSFALIGSILRLKMRNMTDSESREALSDAAHRIATLSRVHEQLHSDVEHHEVALAPFIEKLTLDLSETLSSVSNVIVSDIVDLSVRSDVAVALGLVTAELVSNALKHKRPDETISVTIALAENPDTDMMMLRIVDTGAGLPADFDLESAKSLGMQICKTYAATLNGTLAASNLPEGGASFSLSFPKNVTASE